MSDKKKTVVIQDIEFSIDGMKGFKKSDFVKTYKEKSEKAKGKGKFGRFDAEKGWEQLEKALKK